MRVRDAALELASAIGETMQPLHDAIAVLHRVAAIEFASPEAERALAGIIANEVVQFRRNAREDAAVGARLLRGVRELERQARGFASGKLEGTHGKGDREK